MTTQPGDIYDGLEPADAFGLAVYLAGGGELGVPPVYDDTPAPVPDLEAPRRPKPDPSQGRGLPAGNPDPATAFSRRLADALDHPRPRWREIGS